MKKIIFRERKEEVIQKKKGGRFLKAKRKFFYKRKTDINLWQVMQDEQFISIFNLNHGERELEYIMVMNSGISASLNY